MFSNAAFLFRAVSHASRGRNTSMVIDPLHGYSPEYHASLSSIPYNEARMMIRDHLNYEYRSPSEFSSWSISLLWVLVHAVRKAYDCGEWDILIYALDTSKLPPARIHSASELLEKQNYDLEWVQ